MLWERDFPCLNVPTGVTSQWVAILEKRVELLLAGMLERDEKSLENRSVYRESVWTLGWMGLCR